MEKLFKYSIDIINKNCRIFTFFQFILPAYNMKINKSRDIYNIAGKKSTLLIPDYLFPEYARLQSRYRNTRFLLSYLLFKYNASRPYLVMRSGISSTIKYQETGMNLHREDFRPAESQWIELKLLANSYNMSICSFFVLLLQMELAGVLDGVRSGGVPPIKPAIALYQSITKYSIPVFKRILYQKT